jgi:hypothetical protein
MRILFLLTAAVFVLLETSPVWAEPYFAAWKGVNCNACHVNETGGWIRNDFGKNYGNSLETFDWQGISDAVQTIRHNTPSFVSAGLDFHETYGALFYPGASNLNRNAFDENSPFFPPGRQSYSVAIKANENISGVFTYRLDEDLTKEAYGLISNLPAGAYIKLGKFGMPYGLELADDNSLTRELLGPGGVFSFDNPTNDGVEAGFYPDIFFLNAAVVNGNDGTAISPGPGGQTVSLSEKAFSAKGGFNLPQITLGGSIYGENLDLSTAKVRYGAFGWGRLGPVVLLGEFDSGYDNNGPAVLGPATSQDNYTAYHASLETDLGSSVYLRFASEWFDDSLRTAAYDGFRHVLSLRCYPVRDFKCQVDFQRMDPTAGTPSYVLAGSKAYYGASLDTFIFY